MAALCIEAVHIGLFAGDGALLQGAEISEPHAVLTLQGVRAAVRDNGRVVTTRCAQAGWVFPTGSVFDSLRISYFVLGGAAVIVARSNCVELSSLLCAALDHTLITQDGSRVLVPAGHRPHQ